jgi:hypothetical protein
MSGYPGRMTPNKWIRSKTIARSTSTSLSALASRDEKGERTVANAPTTANKPKHPTIPPNQAY